MAYEQIIYRVADGVATVTLNRPERLNAWTPQMGEEVRAAMRAAAGDEAVRVIVVTGAGRGFCAGMDSQALEEIQATGATHAPPPPFDPSARPDFRKTYSYLASVPKPIIAAVNGACAGVGLIVALYSDLRFASDAAIFTTAFSRRGLPAEHGISWLLPRLIGLAQAADLLFSARRVDAEEAFRLGLVNRVFAQDRFAVEVGAYAAMLAREVSPRSLREMKRELWDAQFQSLAEAVEAAEIDVAASVLSDDFKEGLASYLEKRAPSFTGR
jgi:enoyl-CoA hydratase/carnithine racemase